MTDSESVSEIPLRARYEAIDANNDRSWYMTRPRSFETFQSVGTVKPAAARFGEHALRQTLAGNMSELYPKTEDMTENQKYTAALANMMRFYRSVDLTPRDMVNTVILYPQREYGIPLKVVNVDEHSNQSSFIEPMIAYERGDFMYTRDPNRILAARPADCPIVLATADTPEGPTLMLTHFAWEGAASGFIDDMFAEYDKLGVNRDSLQLYVTPGGQAESFPYVNFTKYDPLKKFPGTESLFKDYTSNPDGSFDFNIDTPHFVYEQLVNHGMKPEQIYADTSDTSEKTSGYSSNGRALRSGGEETNIRDIILAKMNSVVT